jgi:hypothetical protein
MSTRNTREPEPEDLAAARDPFFKHDGSRFYMSRNDMEAVYDAYHVPDEIEREWLADLTGLKLALLESPGNWWSIPFLLDHRDCRHMREVLQARPLGVLWQKITFVENQLSYVEMCDRLGASVGETRDPIERVLANALGLLKSCRSDRTRKRVNQLVAQADRSRSAPGATG